MRTRNRSILFVIAVLIAGYLAWQKVHIFLFVRLTLWQFIAGLLLLAFVIFLALDHLINRTRV
ncbi:MAG TPA: hypothetical protein EYP04_11230 [Anaerolineae bacterium]|nr:hypothetical protein [Anaerolineae bacterium]HIQ06468.1 hypothetical protein [Anaerolineae bacterium]